MAVHGWKYNLPTDLSQQLRSAVYEGDTNTIVSILEQALTWVVNTVPGLDEDDMYVSDIRDDLSYVDETSTEEDIDYILSNFYNLCDAERVWIAI